MKPKNLLILLLLTLGALLVHGYHPWAEDSELYVPGIEKLLQPQLFPYNSRFFETHAGSTFFPNFVAAMVRISHQPLSVVLFALHLASIFLLLLACWQLISQCFESSAARWAGVAMIAALLTLPVAGTALYILDQYVNPRNLAAFLAVFTVAGTLRKKYWQAGFCFLLTAAFHPLMAVFVLAFCVLYAAAQYTDSQLSRLACLLPFGLTFDPPSAAYHQAALTHSFHYVTRWSWYEWLGIIGPILLLYGLCQIARIRQLPLVDRLCRVLIVYEVIFIPPALVLSLVPRFEALARIQPMRSLYLLYLLMFLLIGGFLGELVLKHHVWRWLVLFVPLFTGMFFAQRSLFPNSDHLELPGDVTSNHWAEAFVWAGANTPNDALFALDPDYQKLPGDDEQGFRAIARRSTLANRGSDAGAVSMFPTLAEEWLRQVQAQAGWKNLQSGDFQRLRDGFGVTWVIVRTPAVAGLDCPYRNAAVAVCRL